MSDISKDSRLFSFPDIETPLGRLHFGGMLRGGIGTGLRGYRQYGMYAVVLVQAGEGIYRDATGAEIPLVAGDVIIVFPELPHHYGPLPGGRWDEAFVAFSGAAFDAWRAHGLDPAHPVWPVGSVKSETARLLCILENKIETPGEMCRAAARVHELLADWLARRPSTSRAPGWLEPARRALASAQERKSTAEIARQCGLHPDAFRRAFRQLTGETPSSFRRNQRLALARDFLRRRDLTLGRIAEVLGFFDAFHFSKLFKKRYGISPALFRKLPPSPSGEIIRPVTADAASNGGVKGSSRRARCGQVGVGE